MGLFDPPPRQILAKGPPFFRVSAGAWGMGIELVIVENTIVPEGPFRTAVVGLMAMWFSKMDPSWSLDALSYTERVTDRALRSMSPGMRELAVLTYQSLASDVNEAFSKS